MPVRNGEESPRPCGDKGAAAGGTSTGGQRKKRRKEAAQLKTYQIHLIRHGLTEGNREGRYIGSTDLPLSPEGAAGLLALRERYEYPRAEVFFSSPLLRCLQSINILYPDAKPVVIKELAECDFGEFERKSAAELEDREDFRRWISGSGNSAPPGGENSRDFILRTCGAFEQLVEALMKSGTAEALICAHGGTLMSVLSAYGLPKHSFSEWFAHPGCGYTVRITPGLWMRSRVMEVSAIVPAGFEEPEEPDSPGAQR